MVDRCARCGVSLRLFQVTEWLFFDDVAGADGERKAYTELGLPVHRVNVRAEAIRRLDKDETAWQFRSHDFDASVLDYLATYWPLDYGSDRTA
jgi:hypothetical protein